MKPGLSSGPDLPEDGVYKLIVSGKDKAGNVAGNALKYDVNFTVENKPSITNVLNYPNPFSTATQFIFTMTGSEIPSQFKIQILSVTGKVVREIKKNELGNLHIGRNMTDYRWDGKDEYGQMLGNGVYLYRVVTSIRGENVEQRKNANVDKYFKNGYGKLYIMR
jgi:flagellar hook assembly protein FlgD